MPNLTQMRLEARRALLSGLGIQLKSLLDAVARAHFRAEERLLEHRTPTRLDIDRFCESTAQFLEEPKRLSRKLAASNSKYQEIVYLYFLGKQLSALYEAETKEHPVQIYNEYRNAFDHFVRSLLILEGQPDQEEKNIAGIEGHIQRAFLDHSKLLCGLYAQKSAERHRAFPQRALSLVAQGEYIRTFTRLQNAADDAYTEAKLADYKLGTGNTNDVRHAYITAVLKHKAFFDYQRSNYDKFRWAKLKLYVLVSMANNSDPLLAIKIDPPIAQ